jgi:GNAT superfamily N-acetyltransferase
VGVATLRRIEWETRIYAVSMARIPFVLIPPAGAQRGDIQQKRSREIAAALLQAAARTLSSWGIRHASALVPAEDTGVHHAFEDAGWRLVDSTLEFAWQAGHTTAANADPRLRLRPVEERDHDALRELARNTYTTVIRTRWANDPWLPLERTGELYVQWFEEACRGAFADIVVVTELEGRPVGYNTLKRERDLSRIAGVGMAAHGIAAVDPACRGLGVQPAMLHYLTDWLGASGGEFTRGRVVISNGPMQRACLKAGGFIAQAYHSFHAWFGDP